jgi:hypothetical protein
VTGGAQPLIADPGLTQTVIAGILVTALIGVMVTWMVRCGHQFHGLSRTVDQRLIERQATQEAKLADALVLILGAAVPQVFELYFERFAPGAMLSHVQLRRAAKEMEDDEDLRDLRARQLVTKPIVDGLMPAVREALPSLAPSIALQPSVDDAILQLRCFAGAMRGIDKRASRLAWRFGFQALGVFALLVAALAVAIGQMNWIVLGVGAAVVVVHGISTELHLHRLERDLAALPSVIDTGAA